MRRRLSLVGLSLFAATCTVNLPDDQKYACKTDADCGSGYKCTQGGAPFCCKPSGAEVCDDVDNDCDGTVDNTGKTEVCNGVDDDCNDRIDEGFNLQSDPANCGMCAHACAAAEVCVGGACILRRETNCTDGVDNDSNNLTDCADPACDAMSCGTGCACGGGTKTEAACSDGIDNDGQGGSDCIDPDCAGKACGAGCACAPDGGKTETNCTDNLDNDATGGVDCADSDCLGKVCSPQPFFFTCTPGGACNCNGGATAAETNTRCRDGLDNDCNGRMDCAETSCMGEVCTRDAGTLGTCNAAMMCQ